MRLVPERSPLPRLLAAPLAALAAAGMAAVLLGGPRLAELASCPLRRLLGIPCPTCGGTGVALALARLEPGEALRLNPFLTLAFVAAAVWTGWALAATALPRWRRSLEIGRGGARALRILAVGWLLAAWAYQILRRPAG